MNFAFLEKFAWKGYRVYTGRSSPGFKVTSKATLTQHCISRCTRLLNWICMILSKYWKNVREGYKLYRAALGLALAIHGWLHGVGNKGKKGPLGVGDGAKGWYDGRWAGWHMVLFSFRAY